MNRERILEWGAALGLLTGVVGFGTAVVQSNDARHKAEEQAKTEHENSVILERLQQNQLEEQRRQFAAAQHDKTCELHRQRLESVEQEFNTLYADHAQIIGFLKSCFRESADQDRMKCAGTVCALAAVISKTNCVEVAATASSITNKEKSEQELAKADQCEVPQPMGLKILNEK